MHRIILAYGWQPHPDPDERRDRDEDGLGERAIPNPPAAD